MIKIIAQYNASRPSKAGREPSDELPYLLNRSSISIGKRSPGPKCSLDGYMEGFLSEPSTPEAERRMVPNGFGQNFFNASTTNALARRTMTLPVNSMHYFFNNEMVKGPFRPIVWENTQGDDFCTATFQEIGGTIAKSLGTRRLCGCTVLVVVSRTGVYMAHYWENIAFAPDPDWIIEHGTPENVFEQTVIKGLRVGVQGVDPLPEQISLTKVASQITAGENIKGYIIGPDKNFDFKENPGNYETYKERWARIRKTVGEIIPALKDDDPVNSPNPLWTEIRYKKLLPNDRRLGTTAAGKVLFKYDPDHEGKKKAAMWVENNLADRHNDEWT